MAGFRKAKAEQAALKVGVYGPPGSGKTFSTLLFAEGLAALTGKRVAYVDTERGTDFYCQAVAERKIHPEAFDFDALYTKSLTETLAEVRKLDPATHSVVVIDSVTHLWEAARLAYAGKVTRAGTIPFNAWGTIKKPYKELMSVLLNSPLHVFILGRQGNDFEEDEESGEMKKVGVKMKAEGETAYEPHILLRAEMVKDKAGNGTPTLFAEKDRTGILSGRTIAWPKFDNVVKPLLGLLGSVQAQVASEDETSEKDATALSEAERAKEVQSADHLRSFKAQFDLCKTPADVKQVSSAITPAIKKEMVPAHLEELRAKWAETDKRVGPVAVGAGA